MTLMRIVGALLLVVGLVTLLWGGVFWTRENTVIDAGPVEVTTEDRDGIALPPIVGGLALVAGRIDEARGAETPSLRALAAQQGVPWIRSHCSWARSRRARRPLCRTRRALS